ncbi:hypothetical protein ACIQNU_33170 [Streptomyces sp. NPDC091292]
MPRVYRPEILNTALFVDEISSRRQLATATPAHHLVTLVTLVTA